MKDLISIIIPIYNCEKYIKRCVDSILNQHYTNIEVIIIDDGSTDKSYDICNYLAKIDNRVHVFSIKNSGVSNARNYGISKSNGKYISFIDSDDWIDEDFYIELLKGYEINNVDLSVVSYKKVFDYDETNRDKADVDSSKSFIYNKDEACIKILKERDFFGFCWNKLYRSSLIKKMGDNPFNLNYHMCEDTLFNIGYLGMCNEVYFIDSKLYYYYQREGSITQQKKYNPKRVTGLDALDEIYNMLEDYSPICRECLSEFFLFNYYLILITINDKEIRKDLKLKYNQKNSFHYKSIKSSKIISFKSKIKISLRYFFPYLYDKIYHIKEELVK